MLETCQVGARGTSMSRQFHPEACQDLMEVQKIEFLEVYERFSARWGAQHLGISPEALGQSIKLKAPPWAKSPAKWGRGRRVKLIFPKHIARSVQA